MTKTKLVTQTECVESATDSLAGMANLRGQNSRLDSKHPVGTSPSPEGMTDD